MPVFVKCDWCGKQIKRKPVDLKRREHHFCSKKHSALYQSKNHVGEKSSHWKGGRTFQKAVGYYYCRHNGKDVTEQRIIAEKALGRTLKSNEVVHHINGNKTDNRNCNLLICTKAYHQWLHAKMANLYMQEHFSRRSEEESSLQHSLNSVKPLRKRGNTEPSPKREGVETVKGASKKDEDTVQTTNNNVVAKAIVVMDPRMCYVGDL